MVGSKTKPQESKAWSVLTKLGKEPMHMGAVGTAAATKLALNQLIASLTVRDNWSFLCVQVAMRPLANFAVLVLTGTQSCLATMVASGQS